MNISKYSSRWCKELYRVRVALHSDSRSRWISIGNEVRWISDWEGIKLVLISPEETISVIINDSCDFECTH